MRTVVFGLTMAVCAAVMMVASTPASAATYKMCWSHYDAEFEVSEPVWANGGGHDEHEGDSALGIAATRAECESLFYLSLPV